MRFLVKIRLYAKIGQNPPKNSAKTPKNRPFLM
jgi:hypothetical protein